MICEEHKQDAHSKCTWCSKAICQKCVSWAHGKKICPDCFAKLSSQGVQFHSKKPKGPVQNRDPELTEERIRQGKEMIHPPEKKGPRIRNVPDDR